MFKDFRKIDYPVYDQNNNLIFNNKVTDISLSYFISIDSSEKSFDYIFEFYELEEYETPMEVSMKLYDTPKYYWIILNINNVINPYTDWFMDNESLRRYVAKKYAIGSPSMEEFLSMYHHGETNEAILSRIKSIYAEGYSYSPDYKRLMNRFSEYQKLYYNIFIDRIHHFKDITFSDERIISDFESAIYFTMVNNKEQLPEYIIPVTNFEYEKIENDKRKIIKVLSLDQMRKFEAEIKSVLK